MSLEVALSLILFAFASSITPGPNNIMLLTSGVNYGFMRTIPHLLGVALGFGFMCICIGFGLGSLVQVYPQLLDYLKIAATIYLVYLSWRIAFSKAIAKADKNARPMTFIGACLFQWVNPKALIMALTAISLYVNPESPILSVLLVSVIFTIVNLPSIGVWAGFGTGLRSFLSQPARLRIFNITMGVLLILSVVPIVLT